MVKTPVPNKDVGQQPDMSMVTNACDFVRYAGAERGSRPCREDQFKKLHRHHAAHAEEEISDAVHSDAIRLFTRRRHAL